MNTYSASTNITINAPRSAVWEALTTPALVKQYFFGTDLVTTWEVGTPIYFRGEWEGQQYEDKGTVLEFAPETSLAFNYWSPASGIEDKPELYQVIRYELTDEGDGTKVTITQSNVDAQERANHSVENWQQVLEGMKKLVEARQ
ncbi:MAG TPA: SRPBCC family protein [Verrucomicrobiae bacterium]|nr:SRPBCC family protein [Verrucomicrobiae bacterium]